LAQDLNDELVPVVVGLMTRTQGVIAVKAALQLLGRSGGGALRLPLLPLDEKGRAVLHASLIDGGVSGLPV
jgi:4-hydroxy-tetrahydrodipicolinate synthase